jgi:long-chain acyl-CoA synthetase
MNAADYLLECGRDADVAIVHAGVLTTFGQLRRYTRQMRDVLLNSGVVPGQRVGIVGNNSLYWIVSYLGILQSNSIAVPFPGRLNNDDLKALSGITGCTALCVDKMTSARKVQTIDVPLVLYNTGEVQKLEAQSAAANIVRAPKYEREHIASLMFTSGTSGLPNAVRISHANIISNTKAILDFLPLQRDDRMGVVLPLDYCFGTSLLHTHLRAGGSVVLSQSVFIEDMLHDIIEARCTGLAGVPTLFHRLLRESTFNQRSWDSLKYILQAGGRLADVYLMELMQTVPHSVKIFVMYGQTEATARLSYLPPEYMLSKMGSVGRGVQGIRLSILDEADCPAAPGQVGEIVAEGDSIAQGYWIPDSGRSSFRDGRLYTGDYGYCDSEGFIFIVGRARDFIKPNGYRIGCGEIERVIAEISDVVEVAVIGVPDLEWGEAAKAYIVAGGEIAIQPEDVLRHCRARLPAVAVPRDVVFLQELPKSASGKILKRSLTNPSDGQEL